MPAGDRHPEAFDARRMRFGGASALVRLLDDHLLRFRREAEEGRLREMTCPAELQEIGSLVEIGVDRAAEFVRPHRHQLFAAALGDEVVHLLLEERQLSHDPAERKRVRPAPAEDVARGENPRADRVAARDGVAHLHQRHERAVTVANRRDAVAQIDLGGLEDDGVLPWLITNERLVPVVLAAVQRQVDVGVDETREDPLAAGVDLPGARGHRDAAARADRGNASAPNQHDRVRGRRAAVAVDDGAAHQGRDGRRRLPVPLKWQPRGGGGARHRASHHGQQRGRDARG